MFKWLYLGQVLSDPNKNLYLEKLILITGFVVQGHIYNTTLCVWFDKPVTDAV